MQKTFQNFLKFSISLIKFKILFNKDIVGGGGLHYFLTKSGNFLLSDSNNLLKVYLLV